MMKAEKNIPELRFPEFDGEWHEKTLGEISLKIGSGSTPKGGEEVYQTVGIPFIRSQNIVDNQLILDDTCIPKDVHDRMSGSKVLSNDVLLNITGASIGRSCVVPKNFQEGNVNQHVSIIRLKKYNPIFLQLFIASHKGQKLIYEGQTGSGREGLNFESIKRFKISFPSTPEQQKIASFLSSVDQRIQLLTQKKEQLEQYKKGVMQQIFSRQLRFKDEQGKEYPEWEEKRLGDISIIFKGKGISKEDITPGGHIECIRYGELYTFYKETIIDVVSKTSQQSKELIFSKKHDVIIPASGETQIDIARASCVMKDGVALGGDLNIIRTDLNGVYLAYYINGALKYEIAKAAQGISVIHLYGSQLRDLKIKLPSKIEQQKIASFLSFIDDKITHVNTQIEQTRKWKQGLLQKMFI